MSHRLPQIMRAMIGKEFRIMMRERHQISTTAIVFLFGLLGLFIPAHRWAAFAEKSRAETAVAATQVGVPPATASATTAPAAAPPTLSDADLIRSELLSNNAAVIRWIILLGTTMTAMLFALSYIGNSAMAAFAGEKEARTLDLALASPASDGALFLGKCVAAIVPGLVICYLFILLATLGGWLLLRAELARLPVNVPLHTLVLSLPLIVLPSVALALIGVAASARAETVKGAGQVIGVVVIVLLVSGSLLPLLLRLTPLASAIDRASGAWLRRPFAAQYLGVIAVLVTMNAVIFAVARAIVRRHRMLL